MGHIDRSRKNNGDRNNGNIGKKYFELIEQSSLSDEEKVMGRKELIEVIQEVKSGKLDSFRMKIRGIHSQPFGGQEGGRKIQLEKKGFTIIRIHGNSLKRDVIECPVETIKGSKHPAIYPEYIIQQFINMLTREGDLVLDPFIGSGTTAIACKNLSRYYIGFEINPEYCAYAEERLNSVEFQSVLEFY
jgi:site-specific DNA-methyltransferase (adenine-specific)